MVVMARARKPKIDKSGRTSAGMLVWRRRKGRLEVLLGHPGGPYFAGKDADHWTVLKGEVEPGEDLVAVARREFAEETGHQVPDGPMIDLGKSGRSPRFVQVFMALPVADGPTYEMAFV